MLAQIFGQLAWHVQRDLRHGLGTVQSDISITKVLLCEYQGIILIQFVCIKVCNWAK